MTHEVPHLNLHNHPGSLLPASNITEPQGIVDLREPGSLDIVTRSCGGEVMVFGLPFLRHWWLLGRPDWGKTKQEHNKDTSKLRLQIFNFFTYNLKWEGLSLRKRGDLISLRESFTKYRCFKLGEFPQNWVYFLYQLRTKVFISLLVLPPSRTIS